MMQIKQDVINTTSNLFLSYMYLLRVQTELISYTHDDLSGHLNAYQQVCVNTVM